MIRFEFLKDCSKCNMKNKLKVGNNKYGEAPLRSYSTNLTDSSLDVGEIVVICMRVMAMEIGI